jgi:hypothetical protein
VTVKNKEHTILQFKMHLTLNVFLQLRCCGRRGWQGEKIPHVLGLINNSLISAACEKCLTLFICGGKWTIGNLCVPFTWGFQLEPVNVLMALPLHQVWAEVQPYFCLRWICCLWSLSQDSGISTLFKIHYTHERDHNSDLLSSLQGMSLNKELQ